MRRSSVTVAESWPAMSRDRARVLVAEYGKPQGETPDTLEWSKKADPWSRVRVRRDGLIEETVPYAIPEERVAQVRTFGERLYIDMLHEEVTVIGESEEVNRLMLNLMHDVLVGDKTLGQAWEKYEWSQRALRWHWPDPYIVKLRFHTDMGHLETKKAGRRSHFRKQDSEKRVPFQHGGNRVVESGAYLGRSY